MFAWRLTAQLFAYGFSKSFGVVPIAADASPIIHFIASVLRDGKAKPFGIITLIGRAAFFAVRPLGIVRWFGKRLKIIGGHSAGVV